MKEDKAFVSKRLCSPTSNPERQTVKQAACSISIRPAPPLPPSIQPYISSYRAKLAQALPHRALFYTSDLLCAHLGATIQKYPHTALQLSREGAQ